MSGINYERGLRNLTKFSEIFNFENKRRKILKIISKFLEDLKRKLENILETSIGKLLINF